MKKILLIILSSLVFLNCTAAQKAQNLRKKILVNIANARLIGHRALRFTNQFRTKNGLSKLNWDQNLFKIAQDYSQKMANNNVRISHQGFDQRFNMFKKSSRRVVKRFGENLYQATIINMPQKIARRAVDGWIKSPPHKKNLLSNFNHCAIGVARSAKGTWYLTQLFALY